MIDQFTINQIVDLPLTDIIGPRVKLERKGNVLQGLCPFHNEKTPSFTVYLKTNTYHCFGCSEHGNGITFVQKIERVPFYEACRLIAERHGIRFTHEKISDEKRESSQKIQSIYNINEIACQYFVAQINSHENSIAREYALSRWTDESITRFAIGFAPNKWSGLIDYMRGKGISNEQMSQAGLISSGNKKPGQYFDFFRGRLIIPIYNLYSQISGFTGRYINENSSPKYLNTRQTDAFNKGKILFGMHLAIKSIKEKDSLYLVEGNADVIKLHQLGIYETVGTSGTSLTNHQAKEIKRICSSVTIIGDNDPAGNKAVNRSAKMLINEGLSCKIVRLPEGASKADPDSFFKSEGQFHKYVAKNTKDFILDLVETMSKNGTSPDQKHHLISEVTSLIVRLNPGIHDIYMDQVSKIVKPKKAWTDKLKELTRDNGGSNGMDTQQLPKNIDKDKWLKFGFYQENNCYYFNTSRGIQRGSNFVMEPLYHLKSVEKAKRLFRITNEHGQEEVMEFLQSDLVSLSKFQERVESLGNFLWEAKETELKKLKRFLYLDTESCVEIKQLGWQKDNFYAWGNGIFNSSFCPVNENGIVKHSGKSYYLPAFSKMFENETGLFVNEKHFIHTQKGTVGLKDYSEKLIQVFGENACIALCYYFASLFRDIIVGHFDFFPLLNLFGPKGTGKSELAVSIMSFFGIQGKGPNINNTSKPALADHVAQVSNACVHIDEYKNNIDFEKIEFLKGLWDGTGRTRMNMNKDGKKETTAVDSGIILSGQEMPTIDNALYSRLIYLTFYTVEYDDDAKARFMELKQLEKYGNTHITNELLCHRDIVKGKIISSYEVVCQDLNEELYGAIIEDRIFKNWVLPIAVFHAIRDKIEVSFTYKELIILAAKLIKIQNSETKKSNEITAFFEKIEYMVSDNLIREDVDFKVVSIDSITLKEGKKVFPDRTNVLYLDTSRVFQIYRKQGRLAGENPLPVRSLENYLTKYDKFIGISRQRLKFIDPLINDISDKTKPKYVMVFYYDDLGINIHSDEDLTENEEEVPF